MAHPPLPILHHPSSPRPHSYPPSTSQHYPPFRTRSLRTRSTTRCALGALTIVCLIFLLNELRCAKYGCVARAGWYGSPPSGATAGSMSKGNAYPSNPSSSGSGNAGGATGGPKESETADWWLNRVWPTYNKPSKPKEETKGKGKEDGGWIGLDQGTFVTSGTSGQLDEGPDNWNSDSTYPGYSAVEEHMKWETTGGSNSRPAGAEYPSLMGLGVASNQAFKPAKPSAVLYEDPVETSKDGLQAAYHNPDPKNSAVQKPSVAPVADKPSAAPVVERPSPVSVVEQPKTQSVGNAQPATNAVNSNGKEGMLASEMDVRPSAAVNQAVKASEPVVKPSAGMTESSNGAGSMAVESVDKTSAGGVKEAVKASEPVVKLSAAMNESSNGASSKAGESVVKPSAAPAPAGVAGTAAQPHAVMGDGAGMGVTGGIGMTGGAVGSMG